jgi:hypothetical protein
LDLFSGVSLSLNHSQYDYDLQQVEKKCTGVSAKKSAILKSGTADSNEICEDAKITKGWGGDRGKSRL